MTNPKIHSSPETNVCLEPNNSEISIMSDAEIQKLPEYERINLENSFIEVDNYYQRLCAQEKQPNQSGNIFSPDMILELQRQMSKELLIHKSKTGDNMREKLFELMHDRMPSSKSTKPWQPFVALPGSGKTVTLEEKAKILGDSLKRETE